MPVEKKLINPDFEIKIIRVGKEQTPVMVIDDFLLDTKDVIANACEFGQFTRASTYYPGNRANLPRSYVIKVLQSIYLQICELYKIPEALNLKPQATTYSLITHQPEELHVLQRIPHFDSTNPYYFAVLHYLSDRCHGDTGFFRHRPTGFESITASRESVYLDSTKEHFMKFGEPLPAYCTETNDHYELYDKIEYKPNRLAIYPGNLLHSTLVNTDTDIDDNPATGRLTANIFIDFL
ncbi:hypothetical protein CA267_007655 [Alteromonas pelagimontana]|uniref:2OG-Fe(II) oxygenase n=1 Tax=Alteromonas pelagimontana TaxID=1858656 RepID=A0A6M4MBT5_9ALTE|nr:DUF6445 family protein [Alteromonas pelagimontana]QJR80664.1 hypothetical protein CA267_007655 [Alteromonas pelagimontana]